MYNVCTTIELCLLDSLSHPANPVLKLLVGGVDSEGELECFLSLLLADLPQLAAELVILVIPGSEHSVALAHHLQGCDMYTGNNWDTP